MGRVGLSLRLISRGKNLGRMLQTTKSSVTAAGSQLWMMHRVAMQPWHILQSLQLETQAKVWAENSNSNTSSATSDIS